MNERDLTALAGRIVVGTAVGAPVTLEVRKDINELHAALSQPHASAQEAAPCLHCDGTGDAFGSFACEHCYGTGKAAPHAPAPVQAAPTDLDDWRIDTSAGRPILVHRNCSVIEAEEAFYVLKLIAADRATPADSAQPAAEDHVEDEVCSGPCGICDDVAATPAPVAADTLTDRQIWDIWREGQDAPADHPVHTMEFDLWFARAILAATPARAIPAQEQAVSAAEDLLTEIRTALNASGVWHLGMGTVDAIKALIKNDARYRWLRSIDSAAEWNRVGHYAADALDAVIDAARNAQGESKP